MRMVVRVNVRLRIKDDYGPGLEFEAQDASQTVDDLASLDADGRSEPPIDQVLPTGSSTIAPGLSLPVA
jgi:hypothetical protein